MAAKGRNARDKNKKQGKRGGSVTLLAILIVLASAVAPAMMLVMAVGMVPSIVLLAVGSRDQRGAIPSMVALNLAGVLPVLGSLFERGVSIQTALSLLSDIYNWALMYGAAATAGMLMWAGPAIAQVIVDMQAQSRRRHLEKQRRKMLEEWGGGLLSAVQGTAAADKAE